MTGTQSIDRAAQLLVLVVEGDGAASVGELAERSGLPKSTVSRAISALERRGLLQRDGVRRGVRPGPVLLGLARRGVPDADLVDFAAPVLDALGEASGETINLAVPTPLGVEHLAQVDSRHFIGSTNWLGRRVAYSTTAVGKVFAAFGAAPPDARFRPARVAARRGPRARLCRRRRRARAGPRRDGRPRPRRGWRDRAPRSRSPGPSTA